MPNKTMTEKERLDDFNRATIGYRLAFNPKNQIYFDELTEKSAEDILAESIAYLTPQQKRANLSTIRTLLENCNEEGRKRLEELIPKALASSEKMECLDEKEVESATSEGKLLKLIKYKDSSGQKRWYRLRDGSNINS